MLDFGTYPTSVEYLEQLSTARTSLWVKRDDLTNSHYGGSKVRKLGPLLEDAKRCGATRLVTLGALGSHHVLATGVFGKRAGFSVDALVMPRRASAHVLETARASVGEGVQLIPAMSYAEAARQLATRVAEGAYAIPAGGSSLLGTLGFITAIRELEAQIESGLMPEPELIVLALGSGGSAAGLCAGLIQSRLRTRVLAVAVAEPVQVFAHKARALAKQLLDPTQRNEVSTRLEIDRNYLGEGYGVSTRAGEHATRAAARSGLVLDDTYTAKAFAAALQCVALGRVRHVLFWHTLSSASLAPLLLHAPSEQELANELRKLLLPNGA